MSEQEWRVLDGEGNDQGPYSVQDLQGYHASGNITHDTLVWTEGLAEWTPAGQIEGLLPPAPPAPTASAVAPQASQHAAPEPVPAPPRQGAPAWLSYTTLAIGVAALVFFFFPWVSVSINPDPMGKKELVKMGTQTGFQSITRDINAADEFVDLVAKGMTELTGEDEKEIKKEFQKDFTAEIKDDIEMSVLNLIALIAIGLAVLTCLIGLLNQISGLVIGAQALLAVAAVLLGVQMALQFPLVQTIAEQQEELKQELKEEMQAKAKEIKEIDEERGGNSEDLKRDLSSMQQAQQTELFKTSFEPACFATVGMLSLAIFLVVITMSSGNSTPLIIPQGNYHPGQPQQGGQQPQQPQQPGSGLKFH